YMREWFKKHGADHADEVADQPRLAAAHHDRVGAELADRLRGVGLPRRDRVDLALHDGDRHVLDRDADQLRLADVGAALFEPLAHVDFVGAAAQMRYPLA